jgi:hypothetical protein
MSVIIRDNGSKAFGIAAGGASGGVDHRHDLLDFAGHFQTDAVDAVGKAGGSEKLFMYLLEFLVRERAALV